jgi:peroxin-3
MIATAYSHTILFVVLTVQVHLLGGHLFRLASSSTSANSVVADDNTDAAAASHRTVLTETYHQFLDDGLITLLEIVREAVEDAINCPEWNVLDPASALHMTRDTFQTAVDRIRNRVEESTSSQNILQRIIVPPDTNGDTTTATTEAVTGDKVALFLLEETWDLLESPVVNDAFKDCLDGTFDMMRTQHWDSILFVGEDRPLAQVIAQLKHTTNSFYRNNKGDDDGTPYCSMMESLPSVAELSDVSFN